MKASATPRSHAAKEDHEARGNEDREVTRRKKTASTRQMKTAENSVEQGRAASDYEDDTQ